MAVELDLEIGLAVTVGIALDQSVGARKLIVQLAGYMMDRLLGDELEGLIAARPGRGVDALQVADCDLMSPARLCGTRNRRRTASGARVMEYKLHIGHK